MFFWYTSHGTNIHTSSFCSFSSTDNEASNNATKDYFFFELLSLIKGNIVIVSLTGSGARNGKIRHNTTDIIYSEWKFSQICLLLHDHKICRPTNGFDLICGECTINPEFGSFNITLAKNSINFKRYGLFQSDTYASLYHIYYYSLNTIS